MRLYDHCPFGHFAASIRHAGMQKTTFCDPDFLLCEGIEDRRNRPEIVVLLLKYQMYVYNFRHVLFGMFHIANIPNNYYLEVFEQNIFFFHPPCTLLIPILQTTKKEAV